jgi:hypothetical protein
MLLANHRSQQGCGTNAFLTRIIHKCSYDEVRSGKEVDGGEEKVEELGDRHKAPFPP